VPEGKELLVAVPLDEEEGRRISDDGPSTPHPSSTAAEFGGRPSDGFCADRAAEFWSFGEPVRPAEAVSSAIERFSPKDVSTEVWQRIEPVVRDVVTKVGYTDPVLATKALSVVAQLFLWADRIGLPVDAEALLRPELIDRFITEGCNHLSKGTRLNYRSQLWKIGSAVVGHKLFPPRSVRLQTSDLWAPYSAAEVVELVSWSHGLPTKSMRQESWARLALGLGTGMRAEEISRAVGADVRKEDGKVVVDVLGTGGRIDRVVPVHHRWADVVLAQADDVGDRPDFRPDRTRICRNDILSFIRRCSPDEIPKFKTQRLRITWIVAHLTAGTHLAALEEASGVAIGQLVKYLRFAEPLDPSEARRQLVGET